MSNEIIKNLRADNGDLSNVVSSVETGANAARDQKYHGRKVGYLGTGLAVVATLLGAAANPGCAPKPDLRGYSINLVLQNGDDVTASGYSPVANTPFRVVDPLGLAGFPTIVGYDKDGKEIGRICSDNEGNPSYNPKGIFQMSGTGEWTDTAAGGNIQLEFEVIGHRAADLNLARLSVLDAQNHLLDTMAVNPVYQQTPNGGQ